MNSPGPAPNVILECVSLQTLRHHLQHDALRMEEAFIHDIERFQPSPSSHACIATGASDPLTVIGMIVYREDGDILHFDSVRVSKPYRRRGLAKRLITEVITHPANILFDRVIWMDTADGCEGLIRHLRWLSTHANRLCGTGFTVEENVFGIPERCLPGK